MTKHRIHTYMKIIQASMFLYLVHSISVVKAIDFGCRID